MLISANVLGYGAVGSAVVRKIKEQNLSVFLHAILVREPEKYTETYGVNIGADHEWMFDQEFATIVVIDCLPGIEPSFTYLKKAMDVGTDVITCNKELVQHKGKELAEYAKSKGRHIYFNSIPAAKEPQAINSVNINQENIEDFLDEELYSYKEADGEVTADYIVQDVIRAIKRASPQSTDLTFCDACSRGEHG